MRKTYKANDEDHADPVAHRRRLQGAARPDATETSSSPRGRGSLGNGTIHIKARHRRACHLRPTHAAWTRRAIQLLEAEAHRSADTHLIRLDLPAFPGIPLYLKDESVHPTGSLKHRLARSLFLYAICNGWLDADRPVIEASSGSTAISEAYFARLLGLPFLR